MSTWICLFIFFTDKGLHNMKYFEKETTYCIYLKYYVDTYITKTIFRHN